MWTGTLTGLQRFEIPTLWTGRRWLSPAFVEVNPAGTVTSVSDQRPREWEAGPPLVKEGLSSGDCFVIPGFPNLHSHVFQYAMAGMTEHRSPGHPTDTFWTWRESMYRLANRIIPEDQEAIARMAYLQMLKSGITTVGEFHYLHHQPDGTPYDDPAEMSRRVVEAALDVGIAITHLPVLYQQGGFGQPPRDEQRRFLHPDLDSYRALVEGLRHLYEGEPLVRVGYAPHSLRAVSKEGLEELTARLPDETPVHIHIAEQRKEVGDCRAFYHGPTPVRWLCSEFPVNCHWTLVHATHIDRFDLQELHRSGAVVGLCPVTEANLGDGLFPLVDYLKGKNRPWGIGTDSNVSIDFLGELRLMEYGQRLRREARNVAQRLPYGDTGTTLVALALLGGAQSLHQPVGLLEPGYRADWLVIDRKDPSLVARDTNLLLSALVFASHPGVIRQVRVAGRVVIEEGHHDQEESIFQKFAETIRGLQERPS